MNTDLLADKKFNLWLLLVQTRDAMFKARAKELSPYGITSVEAGVLFSIQAISQDTGNKITPAELSRWMFREHHTVSALLNRMEKKGLIKKTKDSHIKTQWRISVTEKGQEAYRQATKRKVIHTVMSTLSEKERQQLELSLKKIRDKALKVTASTPTIPFP